MMSAHLAFSSPPRHGSALQTVRALGKALAGFVSICFVIATLLWGTGTSWSALHRDAGASSVAAADNDPLDLSKPIFIRGALCPYEGLLASFSEANAEGCLVADGNRPVMVVATATNGRQARVFKVDMDTAEGTVEAWVTSHSLRN
jgi:hypothetical protein